MTTTSTTTTTVFAAERLNRIARYLYKQRWNATYGGDEKLGDYYRDGWQTIEQVLRSALLGYVADRELLMGARTTI
ncbi:MAG TPA: hypothetical protein PLR83_00245 [Pyrinomonadaceae bacterium]|nr:hypothetical protein [Pyrinomonadaceae bacterium]